MYKKLGKIEKAIEAEIISRKIFVKFYGENNVNNRYSLQNLALYYADANLLEISNKYYFELLDALRRNVNARHKDIPFILYAIYSQYSYINNYDLAIKYAKETIQENQNIYGNGYIDNIKINEDISVYYNILGDYKKSID
jgi:tetratricopeptide (TPR) repeat protein